MAEQDVMQNTKEAQKTVIAFIAGLLIGSLLVWVFATPGDNAAETNDERDTVVDDLDLDADQDDAEATTDTTNTDTEEPAPSMETGEGSISVDDQPAGSTVAIDRAVFPNDEGWVGVREYNNGEMGYVLGVSRFSKEQGLIPETITLLRPMSAGQEYAVVFYSESGDREFSLANDVQIEGIYTTFTAQ